MVCIAGACPATEQVTVIRIWTFRAATLILGKLLIVPTVMVSCCTEVHISLACLSCPNIDYQLLLDLSMPLFPDFIRKPVKKGPDMCTQTAKAHQAFAQCHAMPACRQTLALHIL